MQLTNQRKALLAVFSLSLIGLGVDRLILGGGPADVAAAPTETPAVSPAPIAESAPLAPARPTLSVRRQLEAAGEPSAAGSAFDLPATWRAELAPPQPVTPDNVAPPAPEAPDLSARLTSIVKGPDGWRAIVNGRTVRVGDVVDGWKAAEMAPRSVVFSRGARRVTLALSE